MNPAPPLSSSNTPSYPCSPRLCTVRPSSSSSWPAGWAAWPPVAAAGGRSHPGQRSCWRCRWGHDTAPSLPPILSGTSSNHVGQNPQCVAWAPAALILSWSHLIPASRLGSVAASPSRTFIWSPYWPIVMFCQLSSRTKTCLPMGAFFRLIDTAQNNRRFKRERELNRATPGMRTELLKFTFLVPPSPSPAPRPSLCLPDPPPRLCSDQSCCCRPEPTKVRPGN